MKEIITSNGYKVIELTRLEAAALEFGNICDYCNDIINDNMYYIAVINQLICRDCYEDKFIKHPRKKGY